MVAVEGRAASHRIGILAALKPRRAEAVANLDPLHRVYPDAGRGEIGIKLGVNGRTPARRHTSGNAFDNRTETVAAAARCVEQRLPARRVAFTVYLNDLRCDLDLGDDQPRHGTAGNPHRRLAR